MTPAELWRRLMALVFRRRLARDLDEEIAGHLEDTRRAYEHDGIPAADARRRAMHRVGRPLTTMESAIDAWRFMSIETVLRDLRLGVRTLVRQPTLSVAAIATFALGIGAATAIFSVAYGVAFRPLPYADAGRLVRLYESNTATSEANLQVSQGTFQAWREGVPSLEGLAMFGMGAVRYTLGDAPQPITVMSISPQFFDVLGVRPMLGPGFKPEREYTRFTTNELVLSYDGWQRFFGGDPDAVGKPFPLNEGSQPMRVVGVMPRGFAFDAAPDAWRPELVELPVARIFRSWHYDSVIARVRPGRTLGQVRAELDVVSAQLARDFPASNAHWSATALPLRDAVIGRFGRASWLLLAAVAAVLLVACANVAGLLSARALGRSRETSIRVALGAGRGRLVQLWLSEAAVLAAAGGFVGVAMAWWLVRLLRVTAPPGIPRVGDVAIDLPTLVVACAAMIVSAVICAVVPLIGTRIRTLPAGLGAGTARSGETPGRRRIGTGLVALQSTAALALVVLSIVFARSFLKLTAVDLGWRPQHVLSLHVAPRWPPENRRPWFLYTQWAERLVARLESTPGIARAAITTVIPFSTETYPAPIARGRDRVPDEPRWPVAYHSVTPGYFETMGLTLRAGRLFTKDDRFDEATLTTSGADREGVAVISESIARTLWPGQDPIGQTLRTPDNGLTGRFEVIGVVADVQFTTVGDEPALDLYLPWLQNPTGNPRLLVRATGDAAAIAPAVRGAVLDEYAATGIDRVAPLEGLVKRAIAPARLTSQLIAALGALALVLASVGVYGSLSSLVNARTREIAVRMALGASPGRLLRRTVLQGLWPVLIGAVAGMGTATAITSAVRNLLFGIEGIDVASLSIGLFIVLPVTALACLAPAIRASRTDPIAVLRAD